MIGARDRIGARRIAWNGLKLAAACAIAVGGCVLLLRHDLARLYTRDTTVVAITVSLLPFIAFYQLFDALQVMAAFILRAYKIALIPTVIYALSLWGVGLGGGYLLGFGHWGNSSPRCAVPPVSGPPMDSAWRWPVPCSSAISTASAAPPNKRMP